LTLFFLMIILNKPECEMKNRYINTIVANTVIAGCCLMNVAQAEPMTYSFETPSFTTISSKLPAGVTHFSGTFTVDLPASYKGSGIVTDYFFTDGYSTSEAPFTPQTVNYTSFVTDSNGVITDFVIEFGWGVNKPGYTQTSPQWIQTSISFQDSSTPQSAGNGQNYQFNRYCTKMHPRRGRGCGGIADATVLTPGGILTLVSVPEQNPILFGNTYISTGAGAEVYGDILANTYLVAGAGTVIEGEIQTGTAVTTGATTGIIGNIRAGAAITLGASTVVDGDVCYGTALTPGAGASYNADDCSFDAMTYTNNDVIAAQASYNALTAEYVDDRNLLNPTISGDWTLQPYGDQIVDNTVVYNATSLSTAAGITLTLDGNYDWVFNITDMLSFGAGTKVVLTAGSEGSVTWNVGGFASIGADAETIGTIFANGYISTAVRSKVRGAVSSSVSSDPSQSYCGGLFSATSYVTIGASSTVSCE
jgi:hypothetical protein